MPASTDDASLAAARRLVVLAGIGARLIALPSSDLENTLTDSLDDLLVEVDADRWTLVLRPGHTVLGRPVTPLVLSVVEEAARMRLPVVTLDAAAPRDDAAGELLRAAAVGSVLAVAASVAGSVLAVLVFERNEPGGWSPESIGLVRAFGDILAGSLARRDSENEARRAGDRYRRLLETSAEGVALLAANGTIQFANQSFATLLGETLPALAGMSITGYLAAADKAAVASRLLNESIRFDLELLRRDGTHKWVSCSTSALHDDAFDGSVALMMVTDISVRRAAEAALRNSEARFRALVRSSTDVIVVTDADGRIVYVSPAVREVLGHDPNSLQGTSPLGLIHEDDLPRIEEHIRVLWEARTGSAVLRCRIATADGGHRQMEAVVTNLIDDKAVAGLTITARDISAQLELQENLTHAATHDAVTGLSNRRVFDQRLGEVLREETTRFAVLFADLDGFKRVNDHLGHEAGDDLLRLVGGRLVDVVRDCDLVVRYGGDEFAILCPGVDGQAEAELVARRVVESLAESLDLGTRRVTVGVSIGIALSSAFLRPSADMIVAAADAAMYEAKQRRCGWSLAASLSP